MSDPRRPFIYICPFLETCVYPVDEIHFRGRAATPEHAEIIAHCREYSAVNKHPQYKQCQGYQQMNNLPRNWNKRIYKQRQDAGMKISRRR